MHDWCGETGGAVGEVEQAFVQMVHAFAFLGVGYGFMQQIIEWIWQETRIGSGAIGPEFYEKKIRALEDQIKKLKVLPTADLVVAKPKITEQKKHEITMRLTKLEPGEYCTFKDGAGIRRADYGLHKYTAWWADKTPLTGDNDETFYFETLEDAAVALWEGGEGPFDE